MLKLSVLQTVVLLVASVLIGFGVDTLLGSGWGYIVAGWILILAVPNVK